jgi:hypothetical protein
MLLLPLFHQLACHRAALLLVRLLSGLERFYFDAGLPIAEHHDRAVAFRGRHWMSGLLGAERERQGHHGPELRRARVARFDSSGGLVVSFMVTLQ